MVMDARCHTSMALLRRPSQGSSLGLGLVSKYGHNSRTRVSSSWNSVSSPEEQPQESGSPLESELQICVAVSAGSGQPLSVSQLQASQSG